MGDIFPVVAFGINNREVLLGAVLKTVNYHHSNGHETFHKEESFHANS